MFYLWHFVWMGNENLFEQRGQLNTEITVTGYYYGKKQDMEECTSVGQISTLKDERKHLNSCTLLK